MPPRQKSSPKKTSPKKSGAKGTPSPQKRRAPKSSAFIADSEGDLDILSGEESDFIVPDNEKEHSESDFHAYSSDDRISESNNSSSENEEPEFATPPLRIQGSQSQQAAAQSPVEKRGKKRAGKDMIESGDEDVFVHSSTAKPQKRPRTYFPKNRAYVEIRSSYVKGPL
ncbi:hypothetical protein BDZ94DRAFT_1316239 [Collybia nuda]|uniref:Uncharacterized protein n=1 Tax=Collybia nuda TaxID=64659 RepID=A0A9P5XR89_9AGAR|nr:hypothetical protein BDZ94DRAFT_1316239 [Collybia nuda]